MCSRKQAAGWVLRGVARTAVLTSFFAGVAQGQRDRASVVEPPNQIATIPFQNYHGFILIPAQVDGLHGTFHLDLGAPYIYINEAFGRITPDKRLDTLRTPADGSAPAPMTLMEKLADLDATDNGNAFPTLNVRTLRLGTSTYHIDSTIAQRPYNAAIGLGDRFSPIFSELKVPVLGNLGTKAFEPFELIVDYTRQHVVLIPLDQRGRRTVAVPAYIPKMTLPLIPLAEGNLTDWWWGIEARLGSGNMDTLMIDTGDPYGTLLLETQEKEPTAFTPTAPGWGSTGTNLVRLNHLRVGNVVLDSIPFTPDIKASGRNSVLGYGFLSRLGVVGFNFRTREFFTYR